MTKGQFRILVALTIVFGFLGGALSNLVFRDAPALAAGTQLAAQDEVRAEKFVLVDEGGNTRGEVGTVPDGGVRFLLLDVAGKPRASLGLTATGDAALGLFDAKRPRAAMAVHHDGSPELAMWDDAGRSLWRAP